MHKTAKLILYSKLINKKQGNSKTTIKKVLFYDDACSCAQPKKQQEVYIVLHYFRSGARVVFNTFILQKRLVGRHQLGSSVHFNLLFVTLCDLTLLATKKAKDLVHQ